jgi:hypothetical protein
MQRSIIGSMEQTMNAILKLIGAILRSLAVAALSPKYKVSSYKMSPMASSTFASCTDRYEQGWIVLIDARTYAGGLLMSKP